MVNTSGNLTVNTRVISRLHNIVDARANTRVISSANTRVNLRVNTRINLRFFIQDSVKKSVDFWPLELWELHSSFLSRILLRKASISDIWSSGSSRLHTSRALEAPQLISIKSPIEKIIDFGLLGLWKLHSSFLLTSLLRKASISRLWSFGSSTAHFY